MDSQLHVSIDFTACKPTAYQQTLTDIIQQLLPSFSFSNDHKYIKKLSLDCQMQCPFPDKSLFHQLQKKNNTLAFGNALITTYTQKQKKKPSLRLPPPTTTHPSSINQQQKQLKSSLPTPNKPSSMNIRHIKYNKYNIQSSDSSIDSHSSNDIENNIIGEHVGNENRLRRGGIVTLNGRSKLRNGGRVGRPGGRIHGYDNGRRLSPPLHENKDRKVHQSTHGSNAKFLAIHAAASVRKRNKNNAMKYESVEEIFEHQKLNISENKKRDQRSSKKVKKRFQRPPANGSSTENSSCSTVPHPINDQNIENSNNSYVIPSVCSIKNIDSSENDSKIDEYQIQSSLSDNKYSNKDFWSEEYINHMNNKQYSIQPYIRRKKKRNLNVPLPVTPDCSSESQTDSESDGSADSDDGVADNIDIDVCLNGESSDLMVALEVQRQLISDERLDNGIQDSNVRKNREDFELQQAINLSKIEAKNAKNRKLQQRRYPNNSRHHSHNNNINNRPPPYNQSYEENMELKEGTDYQIARYLQLEEENRKRNQNISDERYAHELQRREDEAHALALAANVNVRRNSGRYASSSAVDILHDQRSTAGRHSGNDSVSNNNSSNSGYRQSHGRHRHALPPLILSLAEDYRRQPPAVFRRFSEQQMLNEMIFDQNESGRDIPLYLNRIVRESPWERLPTRKLTEEDVKAMLQSKEPNMRCCSICMCDYLVDDEMRRLPCLHEFHKHCIDQWFKSQTSKRKSPSCPLDRQVVNNVC